VSVLEGIDPNPENFVSAGVLHTRNQQVGILVRLEPNKQAQVSTWGRWVSSSSDFHNSNRVASGLEKSGKFDIFSRSGNCQGILKIGQ